jgi:biopolymer transport protein TolR
MARSVSGRDAKINCNINVTPMVDVMLVLLIIFMVVTPMLDHSLVKEMARVDHPRDMPDADRESAIVVAITRDNRIYLRTDLTTLQDLGPRVAELLKKASVNEQKVYVRSDARAKYTNVTDVVDTLRAAGVEDLGLLTEKRNDMVQSPLPLSGTADHASFDNPSF